MGRPPWLGAFNLAVNPELRQVVILEHVVRFYLARKLELENTLEFILKFLSDNKRNLVEYHANCYVNAKVADYIADRPEAICLLHAAITNSPADGQNQCCRVCKRVNVYKRFSIRGQSRA